MIIDKFIFAWGLKKLILLLVYGYNIILFNLKKKFQS